MKRDNIHHSDEIPAHPEKSTGIDQRNIASTNIEKNLYQSILDNQEDLIIRFFATGQINYVNQAFCAGVEKTRENLLGKNIFDVLKYPERSDVPDILRNLLRSPQRIVFDEEASFFGHEYCWIQWVATPL